jgi:D-threonate/D-erythronate kinase
MIGVIADDLTGAAELGAVGLRHGLRAEIIRSGLPGGEADLVCVDTDSRSCNPVEAAKRAAAAATMLHEAGATWIYKKVDSVLRGNVTAEVEAVMKALNYDRALLLPANPSLGRVIRDGEYFIHGRPIHRTEFAQDPEYPRRSAQVLRLLAAPEHFLMRLANGVLEVPENTLLVGQTDTPEGVRRWAGVREASMLPVGGSEFFGALLDEERAGTVSRDLEAVDFAVGRQLFICGSTSKSVQPLVKSARSTRVPVFGLPQELMWGKDFSAGAREVILERIVAAFETSRRVILCVGLPTVREVQIARRLAEHLVDISERVLRRVIVENIFAEGGATSAELVRRMQWPRLEVRREWAPGVATLATAGERSQWLTIKPGSYSWPDEWTHQP